MYSLMYIYLVPSSSYSIAAARTSLAAIVDQAEAGRKIELTRRGRPVAIVVSVREFERLRGERTRFGDAYKSFLKKFRLAEVGLDREFAASTRDKSLGRQVRL